MITIGWKGLQHQSVNGKYCPELGELLSYVDSERVAADLHKKKLNNQRFLAAGLESSITSSQSLTVLGTCQRGCKATDTPVLSRSWVSGLR